MTHQLPDGQIPVYCRSSYSFGQRRDILRRILRIRDQLSSKWCRPIAVREFHALLWDAIDFVDHRLFVDGNCMGENVRPPIAARTTFNELMRSAKDESRLRRLHLDTVLFLDVVSQLAPPFLGFESEDA